MGAVLLGEKLNRFQMAAIGLAVLAVLILAFEMGGVPWVSLALAFSFATYGYLRKTLPIGPSQGFFLEVLILSLPALAYVVWLQMRGESHLLLSQPYDFTLLLACGPITAVPLLLYAFGAKLLRLTTLGLMQYIAPSLMFLIAVFVFAEPFGGVRLAAFGLIWAALAVYTWSIFYRREQPVDAMQAATQDK
jgi:chloramphenicol-sensitive protein RarD